MSAMDRPARLKPAVLDPEQIDDTERGGLPRYRWIRAELLKRIIEEKLKRGDPLPSEGQIAKQYGVSLGTVRKAIDELVALNVLVRQQGKGVFIATHKSVRFMFDLVGENDRHELPIFEEILSIETRPAVALEQKRLALGPRERVTAIERTRRFSDGSLMLEYLYLPDKLFPGFKKRIGNTRPTLIYEFYEDKFGVGIMNFEERLWAVPASPTDAAVIGCETGAPLLEIERISFGYDETPVELRISRCKTDKRYYLCSRR